MLFVLEHCGARALNIELKSNKVGIVASPVPEDDMHLRRTEEEKTASRQRAGDMTAVKYSYWRLRRLPLRCVQR